MSFASFPQSEIMYENKSEIFHDHKRLCKKVFYEEVPKPLCKTEKAVVTLQGPPNAPLGHAIDIYRPKKKPRPKLNLGIPHAKLDQPQEPKYTPISKEESLKKFKEEFKEKGTLKALYAVVEQKVQCACASTDHLLSQRRTRLRELLLAEEVAYTTEYIAKCQQANANREEELRRQAFELQAKAERERKQFAEEKLFQQKVLSCDAARPTLSQKLFKELKQDQLWQIKEKEAIKEAKREEDRMYHDLMVKNSLAIQKNEEENAKLAWKKQKDAQKAFMEQMKWKELKEEQERRLQEFERMQMEEEARKYKEEQAKEKEEFLQKQKKQRVELLEYLEKDKEIKERRRKEEEEIEQTFIKLIRLQAEKEKRKQGSNKDQFKQEMELFLQNDRKLKERQEEEERKRDQMIQELHQMKQKQKDAERRRLKEAKLELHNSVLKGREQQIKEKQEREKRELEQERAEIELLRLQIEQQNKIREEYERKCAEQRRQYKCQLLQQIEEEQEAKRKQKEEEEAYLRQEKAKEEKEIEEVKEILKVLPIVPQDHPMRAIIRQQPPKYPCLHPYL